MEQSFERFLSSGWLSESQVQFSSGLSAYQYQQPFNIIAKFISQDGKALDWGSGNGHLSTFLIYNRQRTTAYGFGETSAPASIAHDPLFEFIAADTTEPVKLPFSDKAFDLVLSMGVLEHVHESGGCQLASLKEIHRILKPGGHFLCFHFPYSGSWVENLHKVIMPLKKHKSYVHTKKFSQGDVRGLTNAAGFVLKEWGRYNFLPRNFSRTLSASMVNSPKVVACFNLLDGFLTKIFPCLCNQSYFIAQKNNNIPAP